MVDLNTNEKRIPYITLIQAFAIILVIIGHATRIYFYPEGWYAHKPETYSHAANVITRIIYTFHMPLFVFLSGYLCENSLHKYKSVKLFIKKRFIRLLVPFFIFGILFSVPIWQYLGFENYNLLNFCTGQIMGHLWFLPLLLWVTLIYLILRKIQIKYRWIICIFLCLLYSWYIKGHNYFAILNIPQFLIFYYLGGLFYFIEKLSFLRNKNLIYFMGLVFFTIFMLLENKLYYSNFNTNKYDLFIAISAIAYIISFAKILTINFKKHIAKNRIISFLSTNMIYIYVIHEPILQLCLKQLGWGDKFTPTVTCSLLFLYTLIITGIFVYGINIAKNKFKTLY